MGVFKIHPRGLSAVTCSMMEDASNNYQVLPSSIEMNYHQRLNLVYAETKDRGHVTGIKTGLVPVQFAVMVKGATQAATIANLRTLVQAVTHADGGYIEYRPIGLATNVMTTWYRYVQSKAPHVVRTEGLIDKVMAAYNQAGPVDAVMVEFEVQTYAWGTSNPYNLILIKSTTTVRNHYDSSNNNALIVLNSAIKGDVVFPVIYVTGANVGSVDDIDHFYVHKKDLPAGAGINHFDWYQAENGTGDAQWTDYSSGGASNGWYCRYVDNGGADPGVLYFQGAPGIDRDCFGKVATVMALSVGSGDHVRVKLAHDLGGYYLRNETQEQRIVWSYSGYRLFDFDHMSAPIIPIPERMGEGDNQDIDDWAQATGPVVVAAGEATGDLLNVDFLWCPKVDGRSYFAKFVTQIHAHSIDDVAMHKFILDTIEGRQYVESVSTTGIIGVWTRSGPPVEDLILYKGVDSQFRFLGQYGTDPTKGWQKNFRFQVTIRGIYGTIFPFEVA